MKIDLKKLKEENKSHVVINDSLPILDSEEFKISKPIDFNVNLTLIDDEVFIKGNFNTEVKLECGKCLNKFHYYLEGELEGHFIDKAKIKKIINELEDEYENSGEIFEELKDDEIDLANLIREHIILELPSYPICSNNCQGVENFDNYLDDGVDPRWQQLIDITNKKNK
ncbi:uncharacterized protein EV215_0991 [Hypnocyclicus thermotrophus]|uniref:Metal-binding protein n=1 Tax=Hypnocyclicus thermotrophus TaxID=1627895 RepID=A0AA46I5F7_9FUSO|nr:DUF177 domain-containing protein [Hypnocyclicus thermotrophus]TDT70446.1 uncharacterized protein EV215_0991 [Hypnocyclicus thermotrophus]